MEERYWGQFMLTGKVEDYLLYRQEKNHTPRTGQKNDYKRGMECESDCFDRLGAVGSADRGI